MERSVIRDSAVPAAMPSNVASLIPDYASLHRGYEPQENLMVSDINRSNVLQGAAALGTLGHQAQAGAAEAPAMQGNQPVQRALP
jgi:hypothetical protein